MGKQKPIELMRCYFGTSDGNTCGNCCNMRTVQYNSRRLRKCVAYGGFHSSKADWVKRWPACGLYGKLVSQQMVSDTAKQIFSRIGIRKEQEIDSQIDGQMRLEALHEN